MSFYGVRMMRGLGLLLICSALRPVSSNSNKEHRPLRPRPRVHVYDMPNHLAEPCWWWGCRQLTKYVKETNVRSPYGPPHHWFNLVTCVCRPEMHSSLCLTQYYEPDHTKADFFWIPHKVLSSAACSGVTHLSCALQRIALIVSIVCRVALACLV